MDAEGLVDTGTLVDGRVDDGGVDGGADDGGADDGGADDGGGVFDGVWVAAGVGVALPFTYTGGSNVSFGLPSVATFM